MTTLTLRAAETPATSSSTPHHLFMISTDGLGGKLESSKYDPGTGESTKESAQGIRLNYHYIFESSFMLGFELSAAHSVEKYGTLERTTNETNALFSLGINFNEDFYNSWYLRAMAGKEFYKSTTDGAQTKADSFDLGAELGKRFSFGMDKYKNISYSPSISIKRAVVNNDNGLDTKPLMTIWSIDLLKFSVLF